ncbi:unnamed protein product [Adineta ricciae]|uniref:Uncharacterized protein n=1 Tax=Adineta ricciae TaxID=249248 RepID=A0A815T5F6_ADIRI|nr:unnamed protein product [Adineta ricciae]CAF1611573.1 unnamed protein product [Adineta ricciae]
MARYSETYPRVIFMFDYTLDEAILLYRKLFYSIFEKIPSQCDTNKLLDQIDGSTSKFLDVIVDYGSAFETEHLNLIRCAFPHSMIYSIDTLYEDLDLLIYKLDNNERKWCIIPVFSSTNESDRLQLIELLHQEIEQLLSFWYGMNVSKFEFDHKINQLQTYDPYTEIVDLGKIHFIDTIDKCEIKPCSLFMAYNTHHANPNVDSLILNGLIQRNYTTIDIVYCRSCNYSYVQKKPQLSNNRNWDNVYSQLAHLKSIIGERPKLVLSLPETNKLRWLTNDMIAQLLNGNLRSSCTTNQNDPITNYFGLTIHFYSFIFTRSIFKDYIDCIYLNSFLNKDNFTSSMIQQCIEQHIGYPWKKRILPNNFVKECLYEILGPITNLHIHIDSNNAFKYSLELIHQLKTENSTVEIEISFDDEKLTEEIYEPVVILTFECNENYVLLYLELNCFIQYISTCQSLEEIQIKIQSSVQFSFSLSQGQSIKWHENLSFIYSTAYEDKYFEEIRKNILSKGLKDLIFITKKLSIHERKQPQYHKNQAIIFFDFSTYNYQYEMIPKEYDKFDQWIWDEDKLRFTGPFITLYPNISSYQLSYYPQQHPRTNVAGIYNLLCNNILIMYQWRSFLLWNNLFK